MERRLLTPEEVAKALQVDTETLRRWRKRGVGPQYVKLERLVRYDPTHVNDYINQHRFQSTQEYNA